MDCTSRRSPLGVTSTSDGAPQRACGSPFAALPSPTAATDALLRPYAQTALGRVGTDMRGDYTTHQVVVAHVNQASLFHDALERGRVGVRYHRGRQVAIGVEGLADQRAKQRNHTVEIEMKAPVKDRVIRVTHLQTDHPPAGPCDAPHLAKAAGDIRQVAHDPR